jgi:hypothetical protein
MKNRDLTNVKQKARKNTEEDLLKQALEQPGVREAMIVFGRWQELCRVSKPYIDAMKARRIISTASVSNPVF